MAFVAFILVIGGSIAGSYFLTLHEVDVQQAAQAQQQRRQEAAQKAAQLVQSEAICRALIGLDDASHGAQFASPSHTGVPLSKSYGYRLSRAIHRVVEATDCRPLLAGKVPPR
jgi:hypothetical protein